jgi:hypothetical protein
MPYAGLCLLAWKQFKSHAKPEKLILSRDTIRIEIRPLEG